MTFPYLGSTPGRLLVVALVLGMSLMSFYVHVLHEQVEHGSAMRLARNVPATTGSGSTRPASLPVAEHR